MAIVRVRPLDVDIEVHDGESLMEAAERLGYYWPTGCHGMAICTECHIEIESGAQNFAPMEEEERDALRWDFAVDGPGMSRWRLACQARPVGDAVVTKPGVKTRAEYVAQQTWRWGPTM
jgi:2Fe-2S ferredoxin